MQSHNSNHMTGVPSWKPGATSTVTENVDDNAFEQ